MFTWPRVCPNVNAGSATPPKAGQRAMFNRRREALSMDAHECGERTGKRFSSTRPISFWLIGLLAISSFACGSGRFGDSGPPPGGQTGMGSAAGSSGGAGTGASGSPSGASGGGGTGQPGSGGQAGLGGATGSGTGGAGGGMGWMGPASAYSALRKIKSALTGMGPTDAEVVQASDPAGLKALIDTWMATPEFGAK